MSLRVSPIPGAQQEAEISVKGLQDSVRDVESESLGGMAIADAADLSGANQR